MKFRRTLEVLVLLAVTLMAMSSLGAAKREQNAPAFDSSVLPTQEVSLTKIVISDDNDYTVDLTAAGFTITELDVRADGNFHEGSAAPNQSNDIWHDGGVERFIPVVGRNTWHFKRQTGASTVTIYLKAYGSL